MFVVYVNSRLNSELAIEAEQTSINGEVSDTFYVKAFDVGCVVQVIVYERSPQHTVTTSPRKLSLLLVFEFFSDRPHHQRQSRKWLVDGSLAK